MKPVLKRLSAGIMALAMSASLVPFTGSIVLADEAEPAPAVTSEAETEKQTEAEAPAPKEEKKAEAEAPKETEAPKEEEKTEAEAPKETEKQEAEAPKSEDKAETEKPAEEKVDLPKVTASNKAKKEDAKFDDNSFACKNGVLTWKKVPGAVKYGLTLPIGDEVFTKDTKYNIGKLVDKAVETRQLEKDTCYDVYMRAYDKDGNEIAFTDTRFNYTTKAEPKTKLPEIKNVKISDKGVLTWTAYNGGKDIAYYDVSIFGVDYDYEYIDNGTTLNLRSAIAKEIRSKNLTECATYKIQIIAYSSTSWEQVAESKTVTYKYKEANTLSVKAKTYKIKAKKLKKKNKLVKVGKVLTIKNPVGKLSFEKVSGNKKILIDATSGNVTLKKKLKKGTYKVTVKVKAAGNKTHSAVEKKVTFKIRVKK